MEIVSIITPCFNSSKYLAETYKSILDQTYTNWEWIVVDDYSTDNSVELLKSFEESRLIIIQAKSNKGAANARNQGLDIAKGRYITFLDSDDIWKPNFIERCLTFLRDNNETLVYATYHRVNEELQPILKDFIAIDKVNKNRILYNCPIPMLTSMYDQKEIGKIYFPDIELREDHAMWINLLNKIEHARAIKEPLAYYRIRENSVSRDKFRIAKKQYNLYREFLKMNVFKASFYTCCWALNGLKKYGKL